MKKMINNIPNLITISRIISCLLGATFFTMGNISAAIGCYVYGAISDAFDGFLARKLNAITKFGKKLDPVSDKIYALSLIVPSIILGNSLMLVPFIFEGIISGINVYAEIKYKKTYTEKVGKIKTVVFFPTMILGLLVTKFPNLCIVFLPALVMSSNFQAKTILAYSKQLEKIKKSGNAFDENADFDKNITREKSSIVVSNKVNIERNNEIKKNDIFEKKKLVRKKDNDDRY